MVPALAVADNVPPTFPHTVKSVVEVIVGVVFTVASIGTLSDVQPPFTDST